VLVRQSFADNIALCALLRDCRACQDSKREGKPQNI